MMKYPLMPFERQMPPNTNQNFTDIWETLDEKLCWSRKRTLRDLREIVAEIQVQFSRKIMTARRKFVYNSSNELFGRYMAWKLRPQQTDGLFHKSKTQLCEILHFLQNRPVPENTFLTCQRFFRRGATESLSHSRLRISVKKGFHGRSYGHNFQN